MRKGIGVSPGVVVGVALRVESVLGSLEPGESRRDRSLACAFAGAEFVLAAYRHAIEAGYRFYSYGDAMLIL